MDPWNTLKSTASAIGLGSDTNYAKVLAAKKALSILSNNSDLFIKLCLAAADGDNAIVKDVLSEDSTILNTMDKSGLTPLIYAICFNKLEVVELLINFNVDCNQADKLYGWTPIMWATYLNFEAIVTALLNGDADPYLVSTKSSKNAVDLATPDSPMYEYFLDHNIIKLSSLEPIQDDNIFEPNHSLTLEDSDIEAKIKLQTAGVGNLTVDNNKEDTIYKTAAFGGSPSFFADEDLFGVGKEVFDFEKIMPKQYIKFHDGNLTLLLDYIFSLYEKYQHKTTLPAAVVYQCLRYADNKLDLKELCETFLDLFLTRVRTVTNTKSGVPSIANAQGDIVMLSYWLSVVNFLYYYMYRDNACRFYKKYPKFLQEMVNTIQTLTAQLAFSINNRLDGLLDSCILNHTSLPDSRNVSFQKEWHFFKKRYLSSKTTYDDILEMLYPPPPKEQMKPSPIKVAQTLGALVYVLDLHNVNDVTKQQTLSAVLYWFGTSLFNRIIANKSYQSRTRAMQIRLNVSVIEDWLRSNDYKPEVVDGFLIKDKSFPDNLTTGKLTNVARFNDDINDPADIKFYYNSLYKIGRHHLMPAVEILQWLQVMTSLRDEESLNHTLSSFIMLNPVQIYKVVKGYKYEIGESKFPKPISRQLKTLIESEKYNIPKNLYYMTSEKQQHLFLNADTIFPVVLPNLQQLLKRYAGNYNDLTSRQFLPFLPIEIIDAIDELYDQTVNDNDQEHGMNYDDDDDDDAEDGFDERSRQRVEDNVNDSFKGAELFKEVQVPSSLAHKTWGEIEENPW